MLIWVADPSTALAGFALESPTERAVPEGEYQATIEQAVPWAFEAPRPCEGSSDQAGSLRALLVGVDHYTRDAKGAAQFIELDGAVADARSLRNALASIVGANEMDLVVLADGEASVRGILDGLGRLANQVRCGDTVILSISAQVREDARERVSIAAHDSAVVGTLGPITLRAAVTGLRNRGAFVLVLLDTCHAEAIDLDAGSSWRYRASRLAPREPTLLAGAGGFAAFYATERHQYAAETQHADSKIGGAFTTAFLAALTADPGATVRTLARTVAATLQRLGVPQSPVFAATDPNTRPFQLGAKARGDLTRSSRRVIIDVPDPTRGVVVVTSTTLHVQGRVEPPEHAAHVFIEGKTAPVGPEGRFSLDLLLEPGQRQLKAFATYDDGSRLAEGSFVVHVSPAIGAVRAGRRYALVIGNQHYPEGAEFAPLATPLKDAEDVAVMLRDEYGFALELPPTHDDPSPYPLLLRDASRIDILRAMERLEGTLGKEDSLVIYYAGHGSRHERTGASFWVPVEKTVAAQRSTYNWISADDVNRAIKGFEARHVLVISDSCFSGTMASRDSKPVPMPDPRKRDERQKALDLAARRSSRYLLSSGANEPVADEGGEGHSIFARALLKAFHEYPEDLFTAGELAFGRIRPGVAGGANQAPQYIYLFGSGNDGGELVFERNRKP
jgi:uncharacterized caspase-like protein